MKQFLSFATMMLLMCTAAVAQDNPQNAEQTEPTSGPIMTFDVTEVDYGTIEQGADPYRVFKFTNTGTEPLIIQNAKGSCGCTVPTYPKEPIAPGESSEIKVRYDTKRIGKFTKTVRLTTNETIGTRTLKIQGEVLKQPTEPEAIPPSNSGF
ncbi:MAG: DUF1573 domain-containing protein [Phaeodactylibacter sp.]|nr:DUF1573 domain-containing protein [Phaeodactylibacter sp.]